MSYVAPYIDESGLVIPKYEDILEELINTYKSIYGQDCYLEEDSADYQWISIVALRILDTLNSVQLAYNNRGPQTAVGSGLDQIVKMNGIARKAATYSTCEVILEGDIGTVITNGIVGDINGVQWNLPATVTLEEASSPPIGQAVVTATCKEIGAVVAKIGDITNIVTPTAGWTSVYNDDPAVVGEPIETDVELRLRQSLSVTRPSLNLLTGTWSALVALNNVSRVNVIENPTNETDVHGTPPHSITCVVEGGTDQDVAETIWANHGLGVLTNGDISVEVTDPITGIVTPIGFYRPDAIPIYVTVYLTMLNGYTSATELLLKEAINDYLNSLQIGTSLTVSALYAAAMSIVSDLRTPNFSITSIECAKVASPQEEYDIQLLFNEVAYGDLANIRVAAI